MTNDKIELKIPANDWEEDTYNAYDANEHRVNLIVRIPESTIRELAAKLHPVPEWTPRKGQLVEVRNFGRNKWAPRVFAEMNDGRFMCQGHEFDVPIFPWIECRPLSWQTVGQTFAPPEAEWFFVNEDGYLHHTKGEPIADETIWTTPRYASLSRIFVGVQPDWKSCKQRIER